MFYKRNALMALVAITVSGCGTAQNALSVTKNSHDIGNTAIMPLLDDIQKQSDNESDELSSRAAVTLL